MQRNKSGQSFLEYAVLIIVVLALFLGMRTYMTRATQAKYRQAADVYGAGEQYEKEKTGVKETNNAIFVPEDIPDRDVCANLTARVEKIEAQINDLTILAADLNKRADETEQQVALMEAQGRAEQAKLLQETVKQLRDKADSITKPDTGEIATRQAEIATYKTGYPACFP